MGVLHTVNVYITCIGDKKFNTAIGGIKNIFVCIIYADVLKNTDNEINKLN